MCENFNNPNLVGEINKNENIQIANLFQSGVRDTTTKKSAKADELAAIAGTMIRNPKWKPLNKKGTPLTKGQIISAANHANIESSPACDYFNYESYRLPMVSRKISYLLKNNMTFFPGDNFNHKPDLVHRAQMHLEGKSRGASQGGASVKRKIHVTEEIIINAKAGFYMANGAMAYMHTDGSVCLLPGDGRGFECKCGYQHVA